ncbi:MAG: TrkH family potassium uptake protein, partial [Muribaculaceae bacterium]|nr:TrkH family potassium uptake protein [Muribaculaceae bacterium]
MFSTRQYINIVMLLRVIGWLLLIEAVFMSIPMIAAFIFKEDSFQAFLIGLGICAGVGLMLMSLKPASREMRRREAMMLTALVWVVFSIFGMVPYLAGGVHFSVTDAFFDTMSSFTTTGLSSLSTLDTLPHSFILWRCVMQWIGGMGIILFTLAVLPMLNYQGGMQMFNAEVTGITHDKLRPRVSSTAKALWLIYISLTVLLTVLLRLADMPIFDAVCYGLSTMSTGGFATTDAGIQSFNSLSIKIIFCVFMLLGSVNFSLIFQAVRGNFSVIKGNTVLRWFLLLIVISTAI